MLSLSSLKHQNIISLVTLTLAAFLSALALAGLLLVVAISLVFSSQLPPVRCVAYCSPPNPLSHVAVCMAADAELHWCVWTRPRLRLESDLPLSYTVLRE